MMSQNVVPHMFPAECRAICLEPGVPKPEITASLLTRSWTRGVLDQKNPSETWYNPGALTLTILSP